MLYIKCDTRDMNYAVNPVCADELKAQGTFRRLSMKIRNEFQVHHFLTEAEKTSINANVCTFFSFFEYVTTSEKDGFPKFNLSKCY